MWPVPTCVLTSWVCVGVVVNRLVGIKSSGAKLHVSGTLECGSHILLGLACGIGAASPSMQNVAFSHRGRLLALGIRICGYSHGISK